MHEYSIVQALIESCETHAKAHEATRVCTVVIKVGTLSGVEPELLKRAFDTFKEKSVCDRSELIIQIQKPLISCQNCKKQSELEMFQLLCPHCNSREVTVIDGEELLLMQLEME